MVEGVCEVCNLPKKDVRRSRESGKHRCLSCIRKNIPPDVCRICSQEKRPHSHNEYDEAICCNCYHTYVAPLEDCSMCGGWLRVAWRDPVSKKPMCAKCRSNDPSTFEKCSLCPDEEEKKPVHTRDTLGNPICHRCNLRRLTVAA